MKAKCHLNAFLSRKDQKKPASKEAGSIRSARQVTFKAWQLSQA